MKLTSMKATLVDVFAEKQLSGNGLTIFENNGLLSTQDMLELTREMRQFESIFYQKGDAANHFKARIFTMEEELDFAGHPLLGLAAHLHEIYGESQSHDWIIELNNKTVPMQSQFDGTRYDTSMEQGKPEFIRTLNTSEAKEFFSLLNIKSEDTSDIPMAVVSTGLPYLIVPIRKGIDHVAMISKNLEPTLQQYQAKFAYILDVNTFEGRTWDNFGKVEDIATGSAAGPAGAFLYKAGKVEGNSPFTIKQGRFVDRPSNITVQVDATDDLIQNVRISGGVFMVATINFV